MRRLYLLDGDRGGALRRIERRAQALGVELVLESREMLERRSSSTQHQGVVATASAFRYAELDALLGAHPVGQRRVLMLDGVEDPGNFGAMIRVAAAFDWSGIIIRERRAVPVTTAVCSAAAGAAERTAIARVTNLRQTLDLFRQAGFWLFAATPRAEADAPNRPPWSQDLSGDLLLVIGAEGRGVSELIARSVDVTIQIPMGGGFESLSAPSAAAMLMYEVERQRGLRSPASDAVVPPPRKS